MHTRAYCPRNFQRISENGILFYLVGWQCGYFFVWKIAFSNMDILSLVRLYLKTMVIKERESNLQFFVSLLCSRPSNVSYSILILVMFPLAGSNLKVCNPPTVSLTCWVSLIYKNEVQKKFIFGTHPAFSWVFCHWNQYVDKTNLLWKRLPKMFDYTGWCLHLLREVLKLAVLVCIRIWYRLVW